MAEQIIENLPTSDLDMFKKQVRSPNTEFKNMVQKNSSIQQIKRNLVLSYPSDSTGCGHIRNIFPMNYLNSIFGKTGRFNLLLSPIMIFQDEILKRTRSIFFQRTMSPAQLPMVQKYKQMQAKYKYKLVYDIDDFIWDGVEDGETIPEYNFGKKTIGKPVQDACIEIMKLMDVVCVSTRFLGDYIASKGVESKRIKVVHNTISQAFWGVGKKQHITKRLEKPTVLWSASPTHWSNADRLAGDMDNAWQEWVIKSVLSNKINFVQMGGLPWFFEPIKDKITVVPWVNSYQYHIAVKNVKADFGISPLVPNYFNYSKSAIKYQEYCADGIVGIGTEFTNGKPSPYDICQIKASDNITVKEIDDLFDKYCEPKNYNKILDAQYQQLIESDWFTESQGYVNKLINIF